MSRSLSPLSPDKPLGGRYKPIQQLGVGGFGRTFLAEDLHLPGHPRCVVKQLKPQVKSEDTLLMARRCFNTEAQVLYRLGVHPRIPRLLAHFEDGPEFYLAQEFIEGDPLTQEFAEGRPWSQGRAASLVREILEVLAFVHQQQVIHRDLKPSNLIRRRDDHQIVLIDFGAVKQVSSQNLDPDTGLTNLTISIGTQGYMPNEQLAGKPRFSSDVYAAGVLGIQALTGLHPKHLDEDSIGEIAWHEYAPQLHPELVQILDRMVRYDFRERYVDAMEALAALAQLPASVFEDMTEPPETIVQAVSRIRSQASGAGKVLNNSQNSQNGQVDFDPLATALPHAIDSAFSSDDAFSTAIWTPTELPAPPSTGMTQAIGRPAGTAVTTASRFTKLTLRRLTQPSIVVGMLAALGLSLATLQVLFPQSLNQVVERIRPFGTSNRIAPTIPSSPVPSPKDPKQQAALLVKQATQMRDAKRYSEALEQYEQAITLYPDDAQAYAGRCETLNLLNRAEEAIVSCNDALAYQPNDPLALWSKGNALMLQNRTYEALKLYEDVTYLQPDFALGWVRRGVALQKLGRSAEALVAIEQGIMIQRNVSEAWITRGAALMNLRRYEDATVALDKALQLRPDDSEAKQLRQRARDLTKR
ncbi:MAG TPA: serine/threonine-protein kinase [Trichocoleus sp.]|jgi:serine/threonine protein kinase/Flp pilus assembly protein TadD